MISSWKAGVSSSHLVGITASDAPTVGLISRRCDPSDDEPTRGVSKRIPRDGGDLRVRHPGEGLHPDIGPGDAHHSLLPLRLTDRCNAIRGSRSVTPVTIRCGGRHVQGKALVPMRHSPTLSWVSEVPS